ncbi:MAG: nucleotidyltransferase family protein [Thermoproteota archaeon]
MKAVILAGGLGTRMRPLTYLVPKPLLPIGGKPLIERTIEYLKSYGFREFVICVAYLKGYIIDYLNRSKANLGVEIEFAESDVPLGTAGQLKTAQHLVSGTFLAMNGDIVTSLNIRRLVDYHKSRGGIGTIALKTFELKLPYGLVEIGQDSRITAFREKPVMSFMVNAGIYVFEKEIFSYIPEGKVFSLETDVFPRLISEGKVLNSFYEEAYWADIGTVSDFERVDAYVSTGAAEFQKPM